MQQLLVTFVTYIQRNLQARNSSVNAPLVHGVLDIVLRKNGQGHSLLPRTSSHGNAGIRFPGKVADEVAMQLSSPKHSQHLH